MQHPAISANDPIHPAPATRFDTRTLGNAGRLTLRPVVPQDAPLLGALVQRQGIGTWALRSLHRAAAQAGLLCARHHLAPDSETDGMAAPRPRPTPRPTRWALLRWCPRSQPGAVLATA